MGDGPFSGVHLPERLVYFRCAASRRPHSLPSPRTDYPATLNSPAPGVELVEVSIEALGEETGGELVPDSVNLVGILGIVLKTDLELSDQSEGTTAAIIDRYRRSDQCKTPMSTRKRFPPRPRRRGPKPRRLAFPRRGVAETPQTWPVSCRAFQKE